MKHNRRFAAARRYHPLLLGLAGLALLLSSLLLAVRMVDAGAAAGLEPVWSARQDNGPAWLAMVDSPAQLYSEFPLARLAGRLIQHGDVSAPHCENGGLLASGEANECGLQAALSQTNQWQNRFNNAILTTSQKYAVPPRLMKSLFAWESQFWPETVFVNTYEFGLGHITLNGADSALRWNEELYQQVCRASYSAETCETSYGDQPDAIRSGLQGVYVQLARADCAECRYTLDLKRAEASIPIFAQTIQANASYVRYALKSFYGIPAGAVAGEEDLWRFTLVSYNAGPGCFRNALGDVYYRGLDATWDNLKTRLEPACRGAVPYVDFISQSNFYVSPPAPTPVPTVAPPADGGLTPTPTAEPGGETPGVETPAPSNPVTVDLSLPHSGEMVVKIAVGQEEQAMQELAALEIGAEQVGQPVRPGGARVVQVAAESLADVLAALNASESFLFAEPNYLVRTATDDTYFDQQDNLPLVGAPAAWAALGAGYPGSAVIVAVLDTGIDADHADLAGRVLAGWNALDGSNNTADDNGHGTRVAGVIGANIDNTTGIAGIAPNAQLLPVKVLDSQGAGTHADVAAGIYRAVDLGAKVINLGFAGQGSSAVLKSAVDHALNNGVLVVAAAGNDGAQMAYYPAAYPGVIAVSAVGADTARWANSTYGDHVSLAAPGVGIVTTDRNDSYTDAAPVSGTSLSAAHVSGAAGLLLGQPLFAGQPALVRTRLLETAEDLGAGGRDPHFGYGLLRIDLALETASAPPPGPEPAAPTVIIVTPVNGRLWIKPASITFTGTALDDEGKSVSAGLMWQSNIDGPIGVGATFSTGALTPGEHTITALVSVAGVAGQASVNITVLPATNSPHGGFTAAADGCVVCHNSHAANSLRDGGLTGGVPAHSAGYSNDFCLACHSGGAKTLVTHLKTNVPEMVQKQEADFELLCIQCHDSHGATPNLFLVRQYPVVGKTMTIQSMTPVSTPVTFTDLETQTNTLCLSCHESYNMTHRGGANHNDGQDYSATSCVSCHPHSAGFMPVRPAPVQSLQSAGVTEPLSFLDQLLKLFAPD